jgi:hypothetical protein
MASTIQRLAALCQRPADNRSLTSFFAAREAPIAPTRTSLCLQSAAAERKFAILGASTILGVNP